MCKFCETIYSNEREFDEAMFKIRFNDDKIIAGLFRDESKITLGIPCEDDFYFPHIKDVKFCPYCGNKL